MQWGVEVPYSSFSSIWISMTLVFHLIHLPTSTVHSLPSSTCSPFLFSTATKEIFTGNELIQPCPVDSPCRCFCEKNSKRLWIDCFYRQLKSFPIFRTIPTNQTRLEWNVDLAFNSFENVTQLNENKWLPSNMRIKHLVFSSSLAYDLIVQLNLTHRRLIDQWPSQTHLTVIDDENREHSVEDSEFLKSPQHEKMRLLADLTVELREKSERLTQFTLSLAGEPAPVANLYLDHNSLDSIPSKALFNATGLEEIYLSFNRLVELPAFAFGFSHRLTRIDLSYNQIRSIDNATFQRHPEAFAGPFLVDYLDLSHNQLTHLETNLFSYLVNLRLLKLEHNLIHSINAHAWTGLYRLKYLDLSHNDLDNFTQAFYSGYLNELTYLKMTANHLDSLGPCEFVTLKSLTKLNLNGNNLTSIDRCAFHGIHQRRSPSSSFNVYLRSNALETIDPCAFEQFKRSTIHLNHNPLICNCSLNYLLHERQSLAYTGEECRRGYVYPTKTQLSLPAVRKNDRMSTKKTSTINLTKLCQESFRFYNDLCSKIDCSNECAAQERFIIQVTTIATPNRTDRQDVSQLIFFVFLLNFVRHFYIFV